MREEEAIKAIQDMMHQGEFKTIVLDKLNDTSFGVHILVYDIGGSYATGPTLSLAFMEALDELKNKQDKGKETKT